MNWNLGPYWTDQEYSLVMFIPQNL